MSYWDLLPKEIHKEIKSYYACVRCDTPINKLNSLCYMCKRNDQIYDKAHRECGKVDDNSDMKEMDEYYKINKNPDIKMISSLTGESYEIYKQRYEGHLAAQNKAIQKK